MNLEETHKFLTIVRAAYPNIYKDNNFDESAFMLQRSLWQNAFADVSYQEVFAIFNAWLATEPFPPTLAHINKMIRRNRNPEAFISAEKAWEQVGNAVRKFGWPNQEKAMESFSPNIKRAIQNIGGWQKLCSANEREWDFRRKDFLEIYEEFHKETREQELIPTNILKRLQEEAPRREALIQDKLKVLEDKRE